jgi:Xaa-Pro aminopeptidase
VHEGTHALSPNNKVKITPGMVISNEPGFYKKNNFGVRIENLIFCKKINKIRFKFENLTMIPYDLDCIDKKLLNKNEINLINDYHQEIYFLIKSFLTKKEKYFFKKNLIKSN